MQKLLLILFLVWIFLSIISAILIHFNKKTNKFFKREWKDIKLLNKNLSIRIIMFFLMILLLPITLKDSLRLVYHSLNKSKNK
jgi:hypothetical protein